MIFLHSRNLQVTTFFFNIGIYFHLKVIHKTGYLKFFVLKVFLNSERPWSFPWSLGGSLCDRPPLHGHKRQININRTIPTIISIKPTFKLDIGFSWFGVSQSSVQFSSDSKDWISFSLLVGKPRVKGEITVTNMNAKKIFIFAKWCCWFFSVSFKTDRFWVTKSGGKKKWWMPWMPKMDLISDVTSQ